MGRISKEKDNSGNILKNYTYDSYSQLIREDNTALDKTFIYEYNNNGGIANVKEYAYTTSGTPTGTATEKAYTYDSNYPDKLTKCGSTSISYNSMGCPTTVNGYTATWTRGKLSKLTKGSIRTGTYTYNYTYNAFGQRIGINYTYMLGSSSSSAVLIGMLMGYTHVFDYDHFGRLICETKTSRYYSEANGTEKIVYLYDETGIIGMMRTTESGTTTTYYFQRNLLGDVIGIYDTNGTKVGGYAYDAWGNCTITLDTNGIATRNSIRYRGYYYDTETKLYHLNARYYNPEWRRFISPDDTSYLDPECVNGLNLYAYCYNDPVNYADPSGNFVISAWIVGIVVGFGVGFASSVVSDLIFEDAVNWKKAIVSGLFSSVSGALANIAIPFEALVLSNAVLSAGNSIVDDIFFDKNENVANIIGNALICAGMSALFTLAIGDPNSKRITELYGNAKHADHMLHKGGLHPNVKVGYNKDIAIYNKELKKIISNSIEEALTVSPFEKFFARIYKLYYKSFFVR